MDNTKKKIVPNITASTHCPEINFENVWFFEEGIKNGGIARNFSDLLQRTKFNGIYHIKAINDEFVKQMSVSEALAMLKLDSKGMFDVITKNLGENQTENEKKT